MSDTQYIVTVNGVNVGTFSSFSEADTQGLKACALGVAGPYVFGQPPKIIEVRDSKTYQLISRRTS